MSLDIPKKRKWPKYKIKEIVRNDESKSFMAMTKSAWYAMWHTCYVYSDKFSWEERDVKYSTEEAAKDAIKRHWENQISKTIEHLVDVEIVVHTKASKNLGIL